MEPLSLPGSEIVERILAAGHTPDLKREQRLPFPVADNMAVVNRKGQTFVVSIDTEAETIAVQEQREDAYERSDAGPHVITTRAGKPMFWQWSPLRGR